MTICIYHGNCADGFASAWAVRHALGDVEFHAGVYQNPPPDVENKDVILVDFSYKRPVLEEMAKSANSVLILDHHKTAAEDLTGLQQPFGPGWDRHMRNVDQDHMEGVWGKIYALFDMERSGAGITWDFFFPDKKRPPLIDIIEDRDLWRFKLPLTREIQAAVFSRPYDFDTWDRLMLDTDLSALGIEGLAIERKHHKDIAELVAVCKRRVVIGGHSVWAASLPYTLTSDAGHLMAEPGEPFAACYWDTPEGRVFSLRSREGGMDVGEVAKMYGGGGHKNASGFRVPYNELAADGSPRSRMDSLTAPKE